MMTPAYAAALRRVRDAETEACGIPPMTDPLSTHWHQPDRREIVTDVTHALMTRATLARLPEYSYSLPSGVSVGKMWRRMFRDGEFGPGVGWFLGWYAASDTPDMCRICWRTVLVVDDSEGRDD